MTEKDSYKNQEFDRSLHAWLGQFTGWLSPTSYGLAFFDWFSHLALSPAKQADIAEKTLQKFLQMREHEHLPEDNRFKHERWRKFPFNVYVQIYLAYEKLWREASTDVGGVSKHHKSVVNFSGRQLLDILSPSNFPWTNPEVIAATQQEGGLNFVRGFQHFMEDVAHYINGTPPAATEKYKIGVNLAITKGKVVYRNHLIELIQYSPTTSKVYAEPLLIIPAWIMKYYILDLSTHNSLVKYLVDQGHTVFMISWKNPTSEDRDLGLEDYVNLGIMDALKTINKIISKRKIHAVGYCIGGTLLMMAAAAMAGKSDDRLATITLFAAQVDFKDAGELLLFVDESQINYLEDIMWQKGYLDGTQMAGAFSMLRSMDRIWSRMISSYLLGKPETYNDLMVWNYDATRLPYKMHSEYLRDLFLNNELVQGRFKVGGKKIALPDINIPIFAVSTRTDHVAPWKSVYKIHLFTKTDITFVLTNGGHNAGIVSEPGHLHRNFQMLTSKRGEKHINTESWLEKAPHYEGSWWPKWEEWLSSYSEGKINPPKLGRGLCNAPGTYVFEK